MAKSLSATQRTLRELRNQGCLADITEKWVPTPAAGPRAGFRRDLFGFVDVLALCPVRGFLAVQACASNNAGHVRKLTGEGLSPGDTKRDIVEAVRAWLEAGGKIEVWFWRKVKVKRGGKATMWEPKVTHIEPEDVGLDLRLANEEDRQDN